MSKLNKSLMVPDGDAEFSIKESVVVGWEVHGGFRGYIALNNDPHSIAASLYIFSHQM